MTARKAVDANTGAVTAVQVTRFTAGNLLQCEIRSGSALLHFIADRIGFAPGAGLPDQNLTCGISITGLGACPGFNTVIQNLEPRDHSAVATLASAECRAAQ